ncbi:hypothetical protein KIJ05_03135 [Leuconostoc gelidum subsp. gasicomitatum]|uniref:hypothetical protein n=1 Tax=Leuconostoc gasicomitatum TaxID=115778 RepID=UPI001CC53EEA|nr:hypothetical protein [Leuconostoc gasicomitatum]MBZ5984130.1 hypothetical protein [Leuconostoc gasicomitatum]
MEEKSVISTANEIVLENTIGDELSLIRTDPSNLKSDSFQEILINSEIIGSSIYGLSNLTQTLNFSAGGLQLFTNTVPITQLKKYANQTLSSMVKGDGGKIISHSGFKQVGTISSTLTNPAVALTVLTTVIIKQQFNQLNQKMDDIASKLNSVIGMMHAEKLAVLQTIDARIKTITQQENISSANIQELTQLANEAQIIFRQYSILLDQFDQSELLKTKGLNDSAKIGFMLKNIQHSDFMMDFKMAYFADSLSWLVRLTIITSLVKTGTDPQIIEERIDTFKREYESSFSNNATDYIEKIKEPIIERALNVITRTDTVGDIGTKAVEALGHVTNKIPFKATKFLGNKTQAIKKHSETIKENATIELEDEFDKMVQPIFGERVDEIVSNIINKLTAPTEVIYAIDDNSREIRMFIGKSSPKKM